MYLRKSNGPRSVTLPNGQIMTRADLPDKGTTRWVASRKAAVVRAVAHGLLTQEQAIETYGLSVDELQEWIRAAALMGRDGLKVTRLDQVRRAILEEASVAQPNQLKIEK